MNSFSIVIVTFNRSKLLQRCLQSIIPHQVKMGFDIHIVVNGSDSETTLLLENSFPTIKLSKSKKMFPGAARNVAIKKIDSNFIFFLDDDTILPFDYFDQVNEVFANNPNLEIFGGPDANYPNSSRWEKALSIALTSPLATAGTRFRHTTEHKMSKQTEDKKLILCNMWIKNKFFKEGLYFDYRFFRNEENVYIHEAIEKGATIKYFPKLFVYHKRRSSTWALFRAVMLSGSGRLRSFIHFPKSIEPLYFVPFFFSTYIIVFFLFDLSLLLHIPFYLYLGLNFYTSWRLCKNKRNTLFVLRVCFIQFIINFAYGIGFYLEIFKKLTLIQFLLNSQKKHQ